MYQTCVMIPFQMNAVGLISLLHSALQRLLQEVEMLAAACSKDFVQKLELCIREVASLPAAQK